MKNGNVLVSVLIPLYNSAKYIGKCIESVLSQSYSNIEIIIVDDGSTDESVSICSKYSFVDERIRLITQKRTGVVGARKKAVSIAKGQFVLCVDSDDYIDSDMISHLLDHARKNNADVVCSGYIKEKDGICFERENYAKTGVYYGKKLQDLYKVLLYSGEFYRPGVTPYVWNKLIKMDLYRKYQNLIPNEINKGDDVAVIYPLLLNANCIVIDNEFKAYHYKKNKTSICHTKDDLYFERVQILFDYLDEMINVECVKKQLKYYQLFSIKDGLRFLNQ